MVEAKQDQTLTDKKKWEEGQVVNVLFRSGYGAIVGNLLNISVVTYVLSAIYPSNGLVVWFSVGIILNLCRWAILRTFIKKPFIFCSSQWLAFHRALTLMSGVHFGVLAIFFFNSNEPLYQALVIFMVGGSGAAAVGTHGADLTTYRLFLFPSVIPLILRSFAEQTDVHNALALMLTLLVFVLLRSARQTRDTLLDNITMSFSLKYRATHDPLVALLNRDEFKKQFELTQKRIEEGEIQAIIFIDLNNFKSLNDTYGHHAGDEALVEVSNIIPSSIRKSDIAARFGGDEFVILILASDLHDVELVGQKIIDSIELYTESIGERALNLGASLGVGYSSDKNITFDVLLKVADKACYKAKRDALSTPFAIKA